MTDALWTSEGLYTLDDARRFAAEARECQARPRVHPNGFVQLDIVPDQTPEESWDESKKQGHSGGMRRLHIWNPPGVELPHQDTVNEIHDHVFDMRSTVVRGRLEQRLYEFVVGGSKYSHIGPSEIGIGQALPADHELYQAVYDKKSSSRLAPSGVRGHLRGVVSLSVVEGRSYVQPAFTLHDSDPGEECAVTVMEKMAVHEGNPVVICPLGQPPDNDFDRATAAPQDLLWEAIEASLA